MVLSSIVTKAVVVVQLAEQFLPTPEIRGSNPNIGKVFRVDLSVHICQLQFIKDEKKKKRPGLARLKKNLQSKR